jgi:hypothetical protein
MWIRGDASDHSWGELPSSDRMSLSKLGILLLLEKILGFQVKEFVQWFNVYSAGQFIGSHYDAGGDAHLLICIEATASSEGGQFWLFEQSNIIPVKAGDAILFDARRVLHGTTNIEASSRVRRISFNTRIWFH